MKKNLFWRFGSEEFIDRKLPDLPEEPGSSSRRTGTASVSTLLRLRKYLLIVVVLD